MEINLNNYLKILAIATKDFADLRVTITNPRLTDVGPFIHSTLENLQFSLHEAGDNYKSESLQYCSELLAESLLELSSLLYAAGAEHEVWKKWLALSSFAYYLSGSPFIALQYALISDEDEFATDIKISPPINQRLSFLIFYGIVKDKAVFQDLKQTKESDYNNTWLKLSKSIEENDQQKTGEALAQLADFWLKEVAEVFIYKPGSIAAFDPLCNAIASYAKTKGLVPKNLNEMQFKYLEAGLSKNKLKNVYKELIDNDKIHDDHVSL